MKRERQTPSVLGDVLRRVGQQIELRAHGKSVQIGVRRAEMVQVHRHGLAERAEVGQARDLFRVKPDGGESRQEDPHQHRNDRHGHQQLDERKGRSKCLPEVHDLAGWVSS